MRPVPIAGDAEHTQVKMFYAGAESAGHSVQTAIALMQASGLAALVEDPAGADVFVINGGVPDPQAISISVYLKAGAGMVLIMGPDLTSAQLATLLGQEVTAGQAK